MTIVEVTPNFLEYDPNRQKAKRIFQRMVTGLQIASNQNREMRFLTLTTSNEKRYSRHKIGETEDGKPIWEQKERTLKDSFDILRQRIKRARVNREGFTGFNLNKYYCLRTSEGNGVLHLIFWGGNYIPLTWLKNAWYDIHGAYQVDIQFVHNKKKTVGGLVGYLLDNYLLNQPIKRMSYGWGWAWLGFCKSWEKVRGWMPNHKGPVCVGCHNADVNVISVIRYGRETNELSIYCRKKFRIINKPYEQCTIREEKPNVVLTSFLERF